MGIAYPHKLNSNHMIGPEEYMWSADKFDTMPTPG